MNDLSWAQAAKPLTLLNYHAHPLHLIPSDSARANYISGFTCASCSKSGKPNSVRRACVDCNFNVCLVCFHRLTGQPITEPICFPSQPSAPQESGWSPATSPSSPRQINSFFQQGPRGGVKPTFPVSQRPFPIATPGGITFVENTQTTDLPYYYSSSPTKPDIPEPQLPPQRALFRKTDKDNKKPKAPIQSKAKPEHLRPLRPVKPKIQDVYEFGRVLGSGGFSVVRLGVDKKSKQQVAIKTISKDSCNLKQIDRLYQEIAIMQKLNHPNIVQFYDMYENEKTIFIVLEFIEGGELFDHLVARGSYSEAQASDILRQVLFAVEYMHKNSIAHRDLKPENLLCSGPDFNIIKVSDFGLSKDFFHHRMKTNCGTPNYIAPEVLQRTTRDNSYGCAVDLWSIGIIAYILVCGFPPFYGDDEQEIFQQILECNYTFCSPEWDDCSQSVMEFISALLVADPSARPDATECLIHPWIRQAPQHSYTSKRIDSFKKEMNDWNTKRRTREGSW